MDESVFDLTDLRIDGYRNGQSVSVRVVHIPSGTVATCGHYPDEYRNRKEALQLLAVKMAAVKPPAAPEPEKRVISWPDIHHVVQVWQLNTATMNFEVLDVTGFDEAGTPSFWLRGAQSSTPEAENPNDADILADGFIKFDGCSHWSFPNETALHLCGREAIAGWSSMQQRLYDEAARLMAGSWCGDV